MTAEAATRALQTDGNPRGAAAPRAVAESSASTPRAAPVAGPPSSSEAEQAAPSSHAVTASSLLETKELMDRLLAHSRPPDEFMRSVVVKLRRSRSFQTTHPHGSAAHEKRPDRAVQRQPQESKVAIAERESKEEGRAGEEGESKSTGGREE